MKTYLIALTLFLLIDMLWLGLIAKNFYSQQIGFLMTDNINWLAAVIFYLLFIAGLTIFVIQPAVEQNSLIFALTRGALFGLITYATYDLTNLATIQDWPFLVSVVDIIWGTTLGTLVSGLSLIILQLIGL